MINLQNPENHIKYFLNTNSSILYTFNTTTNTIELTHSNTFKASKLDVNNEDGDNIALSIDKIIQEENDFIEVVNVIASTTKEAGNFSETSQTTNISTNYLNIYLNAETFINALNNNNYTISNEDSLIELMEHETPTIYKLIKNLFYDESNEVIINFLRYLNKVAFSDQKQDIMFLFMGKTEEKQGQGAGKGVIRDLFFKLFSNLICSVSNETYNDKFNSELLNKKIVIFDEIDFKSLKYSKLKDITGSGTLRIENKGKDALIVPNVSSWLLFTNENDLCNKIRMADRRTFMINPNPTNESLISDVINPYYGSDFDLFNASLVEELESFTHIISLAISKVKTPIQLRTNAHSKYFSENNFNIKNIKNIDDIFLKKTSKKKFIDFLEELKNLSEISEIKFMEIKFYLNNNFYTLEVFDFIFNTCLKYQIAEIKSEKKRRMVIKSLKDVLLNNEHDVYMIDTSFTHNNQKIRVKKKGSIRPSNFSKKEQKEVNRYIKYVYLNSH